MQINLSQYLSLTKYLLVPPRAWIIFISLGVVSTLCVSSYFELLGMKGAFYKGAIFLAAALSLGLFIVPFRIRELLSSKVFLLCAPSAHVLIVITATAIAVWVIAVTALARQEVSLSSANMAVAVWALASIATFLAVVFPLLYIVSAWVFLALSSLFDVTHVFSGDMVNSTSGILSAFAFIVGIGSWFLLKKVSVAGRVERKAVLQQSDYRTGHAFTMFSDIKLPHNEFERFLKATLHSGRPIASLFLSGCCALLMGVAFIMAINFMTEGEVSLSLAEQGVGSKLIFLIFLPVMMVFSVSVAITRKLRAFWLLLPGDRRQLVRHIDRAQFLITPVTFLPVALLLLGFAFFGLLPFLKVLETIIISLLSVALIYYWSFYIYGKDTFWSVLGSLAFTIALGLYYGFSGSVTPFHPVIISYVAVGVLLCLFVRFKACQRWARIDFTALRANWPL